MGFKNWKQSKNLLGLIHPFISEVGRVEPRNEGQRDEGRAHNPDHDVCWGYNTPSPRILGYQGQGHASCWPRKHAVAVVASFTSFLS